MKKDAKSALAAVGLSVINLGECRIYNSIDVPLIVLEEYKDYVCWACASFSQTLDVEFLRKMHQYVDWSLVFSSLRTPLTEDEMLSLASYWYNVIGMDDLKIIAEVRKFDLQKCIDVRNMMRLIS